MVIFEQILEGIKRMRNVRAPDGSVGRACTS